MAKKKKTGAAHSAARPKKSPRAGRTSTTASFGMRLGGRHSITRIPVTPTVPPKDISVRIPVAGGRFASKAEQRREEALLSQPGTLKPKQSAKRSLKLSQNYPPLSEKKKTTGSPSKRLNFSKAMVRPLSLKDGDFRVTPPFHSHAFQAWKVEYYEVDSTRLGKSFESSFYCQYEADAVRLYEAAKKVTTRAQWIALRDEAMKLAADSNGFIYRMMAGGHESFTKRPG